MDTTMTPRARPARWGAFTLIELLTVIAIIGILAAIIIPVVGKVRNTALESKSMNNLRQIGTAMLLSADEHKGLAPVWYDGSVTTIDPRSNTPLAGAYWWEQLQSYLGTDEQIFHSPAHKQFDGSTHEKLRETISYGWNYAVMGRHRSDGGYSADHVLRMSQFSAPSRTLACAEGRDENSWGFIAADSPPDATRYGDKIPSLFADGHVGKIPHSEFLQVAPWFTPVEALPPTQ